MIATRILNPPLFAAVIRPVSSACCFAGNFASYGMKTLHEQVVARRVAVGARRLCESARDHRRDGDGGEPHVFTPAAAASRCTAAVAEAMRPAVPRRTGILSSTA